MIHNSNNDSYDLFLKIIIPAWHRRLPIILWWKRSTISTDSTIGWKLQFQKNDNFKLSKRHVGSVFNGWWSSIFRIQSIFSLHTYWFKLWKLVGQDSFSFEIPRLSCNWLQLGHHSTINRQYHYNPICIFRGKIHCF